MDCINQIVLRKNENFWIFSSNHLYNGQSPWFSYMGHEWRLVSKNVPRDDLKFYLGTYVRSDPSKFSYTIQLTLEYVCSRELITRTSDIDLDYGSEINFGRYCPCHRTTHSHFFQRNGLVKLIFTIQRKKNIDNVTEINDGKTQENKENSEDDVSSGNEDEESNGDEESELDRASSNDEKTDETTGIAAGSKGIKRLAENLKQVFLDEQFTDATFKVDNREFKVHKVVLGAQSPVFASMFKHDMAEKNTNAVDIPDCTAESFEIFLNYLYSGSAETLSANTVYNVYYAADKYRVDDLKDECVKFMRKNLSVKTFCEILALSLRHGESKLQEAATCYFAKNIKKIIKTVQWQRYMSENSTQANELFIKALKA